VENAAKADRKGYRHRRGICLKGDEMSRKSIPIILLMLLSCQGALCENTIILAYDDGVPDDGLWIDEGRGHALLFTAPCEEWTLSQVALYGKLVENGSSDVFVLEVWDKDLNLLAKITDRTKAFFGDKMGWTVVDIPDVQVTQNFLVSFYEYGDVYMGADTSKGSGRSIITARAPNHIMEWDITSWKRNETNWMIRAMGYSPSPVIYIEMPSASASQSSPAMVILRVTDADENLRSATVYMIDNSTQEMVWSETKPIEGGEAQVQFFWPATEHVVSSDTSEVGPVLAMKSLNLPANLSIYLTYFARCILKENETEIPAVAFFGEDGRLNSLTDISGLDHYISPTLLKIIDSTRSYSDYQRDNLTLKEGRDSLSFYKMDAGSSDPKLEILPSLTLSKSPLFNLGLKLDKADAKSGEYQLMVEVEDEGMNVMRGVWKKVVQVA